MLKKDVRLKKPCPFCGYLFGVYINKHQHNGEWRHFVECEECTARGPEGKTEQDAVTAWNERAAQPITMKEMVAEIKRKCWGNPHSCAECEMHCKNSFGVERCFFENVSTVWETDHGERLELMRPVFWDMDLLNSKERESAPDARGYSILRREM